MGFHRVFFGPLPPIFLFGERTKLGTRSIQIRILDLDPDPDPGSQIWPDMRTKSETRPILGPARPLTRPGPRAHVPWIHTPEFCWGCTLTGVGGRTADKANGLLVRAQDLSLGRTGLKFHHGSREHSDLA